ncbi:MAG: DMT family transporter [Burkholderiaceae bacterium]
MASNGLDVRGAWLVFGAAAIWSFGGAIARFLQVTDSWTIIFWRSVCAAVFLLGFMLRRDGLRGTVLLFAGMGWAGIGVALCFATASTAFIVALAYTTVANILMMQAGAPLFAALMMFLLFGERVSLGTWVAIVAVMVGIGVMVSDSIDGSVSPVGDGLSLLIALSFALATVLTRRNAHVRMMPAVCLATLCTLVIGFLFAGSLRVGFADAAWLFVFGALNLALGMMCFVTGVRLLPAAIAALIGTAEPVLGPVWVWLVHGEVPASRTLVGGTMVIAALLAHLAWQLRQPRPAVTNVPFAD